MPSIKEGKFASPSLTPWSEENKLLGMRTTCLPIFYLFLGCLTFLLWGSFQGCSNEAAKIDDYPLKVCVVSGKGLGGMGEPYVHDHNGTVVKFCCKPCLEEFNEDPESHLAKLKQ